MTHSQIQTLLGFIGSSKGFYIWIPLIDRYKLDWNLTSRFECKQELPDRFNNILEIIKEIDIIWLQRGSSEYKAIFEVEHSTPIYSGLLRFNDLYLTEPKLKAKFSIVSNDVRRPLFLKQIKRPTFQYSGLAEVCNFFEYKDVYNWYLRLKGGTNDSLDFN